MYTKIFKKINKEKYINKIYLNTCWYGQAQDAKIKFNL